MVFQWSRLGFIRQTPTAKSRKRSRPSRRGRRANRQESLMTPRITLKINYPFFELKKIKKLYLKKEFLYLFRIKAHTY